MRVAVLAALIAFPAAAEAQFIPTAKDFDRSKELAAYRAELKAEVDRFLARWVASWEKRDVRGVLSGFTGDGIMLTPTGFAPQSPQIIQEYLRSFLPRVREFRLRVTDFDGSGSITYLSGRYAWTLENPDGTERTEEGPVMAVFRDGREGWRIRAISFGADQSDER
jgi:ketosteroid isomerase-like protein